MNRVFAIAFLSLFAYCGVAFCMDSSHVLDKEYLRLQRKKRVLENHFVGVQQGFVDTESSIAKLDTKLAAAKDQQGKEKNRMIIQMQEKRGALQNRLDCVRAVLHGLESVPSYDPEIKKCIARRQVEIMDLESKIKQIDDTLFALCV